MLKKRSAKMPCLDFLDLFAGGGIGAQGLKQAGHNIVAAYEYHPDAQRIYRYNHPNTDVLRYGDVKREDNWKKWIGVEAIWASPPCQDYSGANARAEQVCSVGYSIIPAVDAIRPQYLFIENVPSYKDSDTFSRIKEILIDLGYEWCIQVLDAQYYGVPQQRKRLIAIAYRAPSVTAYKGESVPLLLKSKPLGWFNAVSDLWDKFEVSDTVRKNHQSLPKDFCHLTKAIGYSRKPAWRSKGRPAFTVLGAANRNQCRYLGWDVGEQRYRRLDWRASARFQTVPDDFEWGSLQRHKRLQIVANGVPCELARRLTEYL